MGEGNKKTAERLFHRLRAGSPKQEGLESSGAGAPDLSDDRAKAAFERAQAIAASEWGDALDPKLIETLRKIYLEDGAAGLERLRAEGVDASLSDAQQGGLEAVVETNGSRPTLQFAADGSPVMNAEVLDSWRGLVDEFSAEIENVASSVGRIDLGATHKGTGFVIKDNLVLTNRHVLQQIARKRNGQWNFRDGGVSITFDADPEVSRTLRFPIKGVVLAGPQRITTPLVYSRLDFAVLECDVPSGSRFPAPLKLASNVAEIRKKREIYTVGYPAKPERGVYRRSVLTMLFNRVYGVKRYAPGEIDEGLGVVAPTVFAHDATTLGGNSGSAVVDLDADGKLVVGLHFAGFKEEANYAHAMAELKASLEDLGLTWA